MPVVSATRARRSITVGGTVVTPDTRPLVPLDGSPVYIIFFPIFFFFHFVSAAGHTHAHLICGIHTLRTHVPDGPVVESV